MPKFSSALMVSIAIIVSVGAAQAQLFGPRPEPRTLGPNAMPENMDPAMCDQLASMPNAPMSAEACRSMMGMAQGMKAGASDPTAMRPGDESMSCEQIMTEMRASGSPMVSQSTAEQAKTSSEATMALMEKQNAEAKAFMARQMAIGIGAGALGMVPGGGIAASAIMAGQQAQTQAFAEKQQIEAAPVRAQQNQAITAITTEVGQGMQNNPRFARLSQLIADKNCPTPQDAGVPAR
jgi:hypothetical protein